LLVTHFTRSPAVADKADRTAFCQFSDSCGRLSWLCVSFFWQSCYSLSWCWGCYRLRTTSHGWE